MKNKIIFIIITITFLIIGLFIGFIISNKLINNNQKITDNMLLNKKYILNIDEDSYIKFNIDKYEYNIKINDEYKLITGKYTISDDNNIILDNKVSMKLENNKLIVNDNLTNLNSAYLIYFDSNLFTYEFSMIKNVVTDYVDNIKKNNPNLAYRDKISINILSCYSKIDNENLVCDIEYNIYFKNYIKYVCDEKENDKMFFPYTIESGTCESSYIRNRSLFEMEFKNSHYLLKEIYKEIK